MAKPLSPPSPNINLSTGTGFNWLVNLYQTVISQSSGSAYTLPPATNSTLGGVIPDGTTITVNGTGVISSTGGSTGVSSFNGRTGSVTLTSNDVTTALTFTPYSTANPVGYQTAAQVTTAITSYGYITSSGTAANVSGIVAIANGGTGASTAATALTNLGAYPATNPNGYISSYSLPTASTTVLGGVKVDGTTITISGGVISSTGGGSSGVSSFNTRTGAVSLTSSDVTTALTYTPYNSTNPNGYINSSGSITGNAATATNAGSATTASYATNAGNSSTVTNGVYTTGSYANPSWITAIPYSILSGTVPTWNQNTTGNAATATNASSATTAAFATNAYNVTGIVSVANGGTGTATPSLVAGTNVTITGSFPNQTINASGGTGTIPSDVYAFAAAH